MTATAEKSRNVYQRKLAVMARCKAITPDKTHPAHKYQYVSIQTLENHLREFCVAEGLDVQASIEDGYVVLTLTNAEKPDEQIVSRWPVVDGDKGWAFSVKFPLMRTFHVGDGDETDESQMATNSGHATATQAQRGTSTGAPPAAPARAASSSRPASNGTDKRPIREPIKRDEQPVGCPTCGTGTLELVTWPDGNRQISCSDWSSCRYRAPVPDDKTAMPVVERVASAAVAAAAETRHHDLGDSGGGPPDDSGDIDPDQIPFMRAPTADERSRLSGAAWAARQ